MNTTNNDIFTYIDQGKMNKAFNPFLNTANRVIILKIYFPISFIENCNSFISFKRIIC